jgi:hypothetical protein
MKKGLVVLTMAAIIASLLSCGHFKRIFKGNPGKHKGHNASVMVVPFFR